MKGAIIGFGFISSQGHLPAFQSTSGYEIVAVADICAARRTLAGELLPGARIYSDYQELLRSEASLDFVDIATPPCDHVVIALAALNQNLHVLCEKPLATNPDDARQLLAAAGKAGRVVMPCHNYKHAPVVKAIRRLIEEDALGTIRAATINTYRTTHARGVLEWDTHWRRKKAFAGGGIGMDHGAHSFYLTFQFMGGYPSAIAGKTFQRDPSLDTEDTVACSLTFPQGMANVYLTWEAGIRKVIYTVHGDKGAVVVDDDVMLVQSQRSEQTRVVSDFNNASHVGWFASLFKEFRAAVEESDYSNHDLTDAYVSNLLSHLVYRSASNGGQEQRLDELWPGR